MMMIGSVERSSMGISWGDLLKGTITNNLSLFVGLPNLSFHETIGTGSLVDCLDKENESQFMDDKSTMWLI